MKSLRLEWLMFGMMILVGCATHPDPTPAYSPGEMGDHAYEQGDLNGAIQHYSIHLKRDPEDVSRRYRLGVVLERSHLLEEAQAEFEQVLLARPNSSEVRLALSHVLYRKDQNAGAEEILGDLMASPEFSIIRPLDQVLAYGLLAQIAIRTEDPEAAIEALERALALSEEYPAHVSTGHRSRLLNNQAMVLFELGDFEASRDAYEKGMQIKLDTGEALEESERYMACYLNYLARDFSRSRTYFDQLGDPQLASLGKTTEDPDFFQRTHDFTEVSKR